MTVLASLVDPEGRRVELLRERWEHILARHPELAAERDAVLSAISAPSRRLPGRYGEQEWFYLADAGPSAWLKVIVDFDQGVGQITSPRFPDGLSHERHDREHHV